jgi:hypothetical protein
MELETCVAGFLAVASIPRRRPDQRGSSCPHHRQHMLSNRCELSLRLQGRAERAGRLRRGGCPGRTDRAPTSGGNQAASCPAGRARSAHGALAVAGRGPLRLRPSAHGGRAAQSAAPGTGPRRAGRRYARRARTTPVTNAILPALQCEAGKITPKGASRHTWSPLGVILPGSGWRLSEGWPGVSSRGTVQQESAVATPRDGPIPS